VTEAQPPTLRPRTFILGAQMLFVAFGALVLVPLLTGLDPNVALFTAGAGTLLFQVVTGFSVPVFLASSFAFIAPDQLRRRRVRHGRHAVGPRGRRRGVHRAVAAGARPRRGHRAARAATDRDRTGDHGHRPGAGPRRHRHGHRHGHRGLQRSLRPRRGRLPARHHGHRHLGPRPPQAGADPDRHRRRLRPLGHPRHGRPEPRARGRLVRGPGLHRPQLLAARDPVHPARRHRAGHRARRRPGRDPRRDRSGLPEEAGPPPHAARRRPGDQPRRLPRRSPRTRPTPRSRAPWRSPRRSTR